ncbi:MAG: alpha/beta fold hydrolase [Candidatus Poseidoniia archaeon]|jgi:predicted esterase
MLHGVSGSGEMITPLAQKIIPTGWDLFCPNAETPHHKRGFSWWPLENMEDKSRARGNGSHPYDSLDRAVHSLANVLPTGDLYICGFSQGGAMAMELLSTSAATRIKGLILLGTRVLRPLELKQSIADSEGVICWMHGVKDKIIDLEEARETPQIFEDAGWNVKRLEHEKGHMIPFALQDDLKSWLAHLK